MGAETALKPVWIKTVKGELANCWTLSILSNAEEAGVEWFSEGLQDLLELIPKKHVLFIIGDWNAKVGSQETPGVQANLALEYRMKQGKG